MSIIPGNVPAVHIRGELKVPASGRIIEPMVQDDQLRIEFSARLKRALAHSKVPAWGAGARVAKEAGVTPKAASKWLNGEAVPTAAKLGALCNWLKVRREWLQYGDGEMCPAERAERGARYSLAAPSLEPGPEITRPFRAVPIVGTAQMGTEGYWQALDAADGEVDVPSSDPNAYALRLKGDSMAPAIKSGWIAVIEPGHRLVPLEYVMIRLVDGESMLKELLQATDEEVVVQSVNEGYGRRTIPTDQIEQIHYVGAIVPPSKVRM